MPTPSSVMSHAMTSLQADELAFSVASNNISNSSTRCSAGSGRPRPYVADAVPESQVFWGSINVLDTLQQPSNANNAGDQTQVNNLQQYYNSISTVGAQEGSLTNSAQVTQPDITACQTALTSDQNRVRSADMAQAATDRTQAQNALQAALEAGARISRVSLLDYIN